MLKYEEQIRFRIDLYIYNFLGQTKFHKYIICDLDRWYYYINFFEKTAIEMIKNSQENDKKTSKSFINNHCIISSFVIIKVYI